MYESQKLTKFRLLYRPYITFYRSDVFGESYWAKNTSPNLFVLRTDEVIMDENVEFELCGIRYDLSEVSHHIKGDKTFIECHQWTMTVIEQTQEVPFLGHLTDYQISILEHLGKEYPYLGLNIGRGDRLMVFDQVIKGFLVDDIRKRMDINADCEYFSNEIKRQYLNEKD